MFADAVLVCPYMATDSYSNQRQDNHCKIVSLHMVVYTCTLHPPVLSVSVWGVQATCIESVCVVCRRGAAANGRPLLG